MLGTTYRYQAYNNTGGSVTVAVKEKAFKFDSGGSISWSSEASYSIGPVSSGSYGQQPSSTGQDNSANKYLGADLTWTAAPGSSVTGPVTLYLQRSTDGGTTWPGNGQGERISTIQFQSSATSVTKNAKVR